MTSMFIQAVYNDDDKCWIVSACHGSPVPIKIFQEAVKGVGDTLEEAIIDWKETMLLMGLQSQQPKDS